MKVKDIEVKDDSDKHLVTMWDNACVYTQLQVGHTIRMKDVLTGWNKFHKRNIVTIRYEDQIEVTINIHIQPTNKYTFTSHSYQQYKTVIRYDTIIVMTK